jgi:hypothetical protein
VADNANDVGSTTNSGNVGVDDPVIEAEVADDDLEAVLVRCWVALRLQSEGLAESEAEYPSTVRVCPMVAVRAGRHETRS